MIIEDGDLEKIESDEAAFCRFIKGYANDALFEARLMPIFSELRLAEVFSAWRDDLNHVVAYEPHLDALDHFKRCGHLTYWLRRRTPLIEATDIRGLITFEGGQILSKDQEDFRDLLFAYGNEYLAFDVGYQFCKFYEQHLGSPRAEHLVLSSDYIQTVCHFLKFKNVSPHAMFLIFKSMFYS